MEDLKYSMYIYWGDSDNAFIVEVPELPGCMADGSTYQEAVQNAEVAIQGWIETAKELGRDIPKVKTFGSDTENHHQLGKEIEQARKDYKDGKLKIITSKNVWESIK